MKDHIHVVGRHGLFYSSSVLEKVENGEWGEEGSFGGQMRCHQESVCVAHKRHLLNILATMRFRRLKTYFLTGYLATKGVNHLSFSSRTHNTLCTKDVNQSM